MVSKTAIDRLGDRLRAGSYTEDDLRELDAYRQSFVDAYETVFAAIRQELALNPAGREAKSTEAIVYKLHRESIRLSQIQDIAGCRLVVPGTVEQDRVVESLDRLFRDVRMIDRRLDPSNGYHAVHVLVPISHAVVEIQVRTILQHRWAELSERLADRFGAEVKYGGGSPDIAEALRWLSNAIALRERDDPDRPDEQQIEAQLQALLILL